MIAARAFAERPSPSSAWRAPGLARVRVAGGGRRAGDRLGRQQRRARRGGQEAGAEITPWREWPWDEIAALVLSPGVPLTHPKPA